MEKAYRLVVAPVRVLHAREDVRFGLLEAVGGVHRGGREGRIGVDSGSHLGCTFNDVDRSDEGRWGRETRGGGLQSKW